jgi:hypothetical protein
MLMHITKDEFEKLKAKVEEMAEVVSILFDRELVESIERGKKDVEEGRVVSLEDYEKEYARST